MHRLARLVTRRPRRVLGIGLLFVILAVVVGGPLPGVLQGRRRRLRRSPARRAPPPAPPSSARPAPPRRPDIVALVPTPAGATRTGGRGRRRRRRRAPRRRARHRAASSPPPRAATRSSPATARRRWSPRVLDLRRRREADVVADAEDAFAGTAVVLGGGAVTQEQVSSQVQEDLLRAELIAMPLLLVLSLWIFRSPIAALLPVLVGGSTVMGTFFVLRLIDAGVTELSAFALNLVTGLGLGLAVDYSLLLVSRYREELGRGRAPREAAAAMLTSAGRTVVFSSLTVSAAHARAGRLPAALPAVDGHRRAPSSRSSPHAISLTVLAAALALLGHRIDALDPAPPRPPRAARRDAAPHALVPARAVGAAPPRPGGRRHRHAAAPARPAVPRRPLRRASTRASCRSSTPPARSTRRCAPSYDRDAVVADPGQRAGAARPRPPRCTAYRERLASVAGQDAVSAPQQLDGVWRIDVYPSGSAARRVDEAARARAARRGRAVPGRRRRLDGALPRPAVRAQGAHPARAGDPRRHDARCCCS